MFVRNLGKEQDRSVREPIICQNMRYSKE